MRATPLPDPREVPTLTIDETAAVLGIGRSAAYDAAHRGEVPVLRLGRRLRVPTARLYAMLGLADGERDVSTPAKLHVIDGGEGHQQTRIPTAEGS